MWREWSSLFLLFVSFFPSCLCDASYVGGLDIHSSQTFNVIGFYTYMRWCPFPPLVSFPLVCSPLLTAAGPPQLITALHYSVQQSMRGSASDIRLAGGGGRGGSVYFLLGSLAEADSELDGGAEGRNQPVKEDFMLLMASAWAFSWAACSSLSHFSPFSRISRSRIS